MREIVLIRPVPATPIGGVIPDTSAAQSRGACLGIGCSLHSSCARYAAVEGIQGSQGVRGTCLTWDGLRPGFEPLTPEADRQAHLQAVDCAAAGHVRPLLLVQLSDHGWEREAGYMPMCSRCKAYVPEVA